MGSCGCETPRKEEELEAHLGTQGSNMEGQLSMYFSIKNTLLLFN